MASYTYDNVIIKGAVSLDSLMDLEMVIKPNCHGAIQVTGIVSKELAFSELEAQLEGTELLVLPAGGQDSAPIFDGFISQVETGEQNGYYFARITALSGSCKLDVEPHSRSFQDVTMTYADVVKEVLKDTSEAAAIFTVGLDRTIDIPLIQYKETDWEFFKRLASHFSSALIPDCRIAKPWFWFGMREDGDSCAFSELEYSSQVSGKFYEMGGKRAGLRRSQFFYYLVRDTGNHRIGDNASFRGGRSLLCEQYARFERGEIIFTYKLGPKTLVGEREYYNEKITGMTLEGTVVKTDHELTWIHLDIDGNRKGVTYPYYWVPTTGNLMYCMPKLGTRASLYIPSHDEREARATNSPRLNGSACPDMADYHRRYLTTEHNKRMYWFPEKMGLVGTSGTSTPLHILMDDVNCILMQSHKVTQMIAKDQVTLEAPDVTMQTPTELETIRSTKEIEARSSLIVPKGTWGGPNPPTGGDDTGLTLQNQFDVLGVQGVMCGKEFNSYKDFPAETPPDDEFDKDGWLRNIAVGAIISIGAGLLIIGTGGLGAVAVAAAIGATTAGAAVTTAIAIEDYQDREVRNTGVAIFQTLGGATIGAITGGFVAAAAPAGAAMTMAKAAEIGIFSGIASRTATSLANEHLTPEQKLLNIYDWKAIGSDMALGAAGQAFINKSAFGTVFPNQQQLNVYNAPIISPQTKTPLSNEKGVMSRSSDASGARDWFGKPISKRTQSILDRFDNAKPIGVVDERGNTTKVLVVEGLKKGEVKVSDLGNLQAATGNEFSLIRGPKGRVLLQGTPNQTGIPSRFTGPGWKWSGHSHPTSPRPSSSDRAVLNAFSQDKSVIKVASTGEQVAFEAYEDLSNWLPGTEW